MTAPTQTDFQSDYNWKKAKKGIRSHFRRRLTVDFAKIAMQKPTADATAVATANCENKISGCWQKIALTEWNRIDD